MKTPQTRQFFVLGAALLLVLLFLNLSLGSALIPFKAVLKSLLGQSVSNQTWHYIIVEYRLPKALTAIVVGSGLALSGLLMQTLFRNPLAGPYVLGISSGASLGVALLIMGSGLIGGVTATLMATNWSIIGAASVGSFLVLFAVLGASFNMKNTMAILIIGLMFASLTAAVVSVLSYFSNSNALQRYVFWSFGSLGNLSWSALSVLVLFWFVGVVLSIWCVKNLNALLLGEKYAQSLGTNIKQNRILVILATSFLAGSITAFAGPIAFIGLAVPHVVRLILPKSNHRILVPAVLMTGAILMLVCDGIAQIPGSNLTLPINAVTSIFGAPMVIWLLLRKKKLVF